MNAREYEKSIKEFNAGVVACKQNHVLVFLNTLTEPVYVCTNLCRDCTNTPVTQAACPELVALSVVPVLLLFDTSVRPLKVSSPALKPCSVTQCMVFF